MAGVRTISAEVVIEVGGGVGVGLELVDPTRPPGGMEAIVERMSSTGRSCCGRVEAVVVAAWRS